MNTPETIILNTSDQAASIKTVIGWVSRTGRFWGDDERMARYDGSTHKTCACGQIVKHSDHCRTCQLSAELAEYEAMESKPWNGTDFLYSEAADCYFSNMSEIQDHCQRYDTTIEKLRLIICEPTYANEIDPSEYFIDELPEDGEVPGEIADAFAVLNESIRQCGTPLSWHPGDYALDLRSICEVAA